MQLRIKIANERKHKPGLLKCSCGRSNLAMLFEGGLCRECHLLTLPKPVQRKLADPHAGRGRYKRKIDPLIQTQETVRLKIICTGLMKELNLKQYLFAKALGVTPSAFANWYTGAMGQKGQKKWAEKLPPLIRQLQEVRGLSDVAA